MNRLALIALLATAAAGAHAETYVDNARVRSVEPQYESVNVPRNVCNNQWVSEPRHFRDDRAVGVLLGNQMPVEQRQEAATALGMTAYIGGRHEPVQREVTRCHTVNDVQTRIAGYRVNYEYHGQLYSTVMRDNPGSALPVRVSFAPVLR
ncbi:MAG: hypothetical protein HYX47_01590 [Burkholderiales bacterium]|nr:hypothetical protein [Burkholderiales bacterium]